MKAKELLFAGLAYVIGVTAVYFMARDFFGDAAGLAQVAGSIIGVSVASRAYQSRNEQLAPAEVRLTVGGILALLSILQGLAFQQWLKWTTYPDITIGFGALGALAFTFLFWKTLGKPAPASSKRRGRDH